MTLILEAYGTYSFDYDLMGNPTTYKGNTFVWKQGRKLASGTMNGKSFTYTYDPNGMRYKKKIGNVTTNYYYSGTQLLMEDRGGGADRIYYIYGASGISGMILQEDYAQYTYYFDKNTLGDIIAIRNSNGDVVARYTYDAWGNHKVLKASGTTDTNQSSIGNINPFRYRGYYYDTETGFYYLQTRYYDPTICRFINADNYELVADLASVPGQLNMYAYCGNNPIMYTDPTGCFWEAISNWFSENWIQLVVGTVFIDSQPFSSLPIQEQKLWKHYIENYKIPYLMEEVKLIQNNYHLIDNSSNMENYKKFIDYALGWEFLNNQYENGVENNYNYHYMTNYPYEFSEDVQNVLKNCKKEVFN